ncbi:MAG: response regulator transcription factor [Blastocatellia bacterium]|nr:response regulator transcription factor [Blastocatellia bacterium]
MKKVRILIADDHEIVRQGLRTLLDSNPKWEVVDEAVTGLEAVEKARKLLPDLIIMDISMPEMNGLEATRQLRKAVPQAQVLVLSVHDSEQLVREVLEAGARGYVLKSDAGRVLTAAVEALCKQEPFFTAKISEMMLEGFLRNGVAGEIPKDPLTSRERQIVQLLAEGKSNKEIADLLDISVKTIETHRGRILTKLNLHSMSDLVRYAIRNQLIEP